MKAISLICLMFLVNMTWTKVPSGNGQTGAMNGEEMKASSLKKQKTMKTQPNKPLDAQPIKGFQKSKTMTQKTEGIVDKKPVVLESYDDEDNESVTSQFKNTCMNIRDYKDLYSLNQQNCGDKYMDYVKMIVNANNFLQKAKEAYPFQIPADKLEEFNNNFFISMINPQEAINNLDSCDSNPLEYVNNYEIPPEEVKDIEDQDLQVVKDDDEEDEEDDDEEMERRKLKKL